MHGRGSMCGGGVDGSGACMAGGACVVGVCMAVEHACVAALMPAPPFSPGGCLVSHQILQIIPI